MGLRGRKPRLAQQQGAVNEAVLREKSFTRCGRIAAAFVLAASIAAAGVVAHAQATSVRVGTSSSGSVFYAIAVGLTRILEKHAGLTGTAEPVGGSHANMFAIDANKVEFAIANSGSAYDAYHGSKPFKKPVSLGLVAQG